MRANPGGNLDPKNVLGREQLIDNIWSRLEKQSVILTSERRIGKTSIIRKMQQEPKPGWRPVFRDLEGFHSPLEFAQSVYEDVEQFLEKSKRQKRRGTEFLQSLGGIEIGGVLKLPQTQRGHWKTFLERSLEDLRDSRADAKIVFFWDEMPYLLSNISKRDQQLGTTDAQELLDTLRALRQTYPDFRMVVTGSIGLHHIESRLRAAGYANAPFNDTYELEVPPLDPADAVELAAKLIDGEKLPSRHAGTVAKCIAEHADYIPFYIHHIIAALANHHRAAEENEVERTVTELMTDDKDPWELQHYRERIGEYYPQQTSLVLNILDVIALSEKPLGIDEVLNALAAQGPFDDRNQLLDLLKLLRRDHYLERDQKGVHRFRFPLIRRWWRFERGQ